MNICKYIYTFTSTENTNAQKYKYATIFRKKKEKNLLLNIIIIHKKTRNNIILRSVKHALLEKQTRAPSSMNKYRTICNYHGSVSGYTSTMEFSSIKSIMTLISWSTSN